MKTTSTAPVTTIMSWVVLVVIAGGGGADAAAAFSGALFQKAPPMQRKAPSKVENCDVELPDFDELFARIRRVSPLAEYIMDNSNDSGSSNTDDDVAGVAISPAGGANKKKGFDAISEKKENLDWKTMESNPHKTVHRIDKIDRFRGRNAPLLRFRSTLEGSPSSCAAGGEFFASYTYDLTMRKRWDCNIENVYEIYPIHDLDAANIAMGFGRKYGDCTRLGVGYCRTRANPLAGISPREQLTLCGVQDFATDDSCLFWGIEMEEWHDHMLPGHSPRCTRAKSHLFSVALAPGTLPNTLDVEYVLQLEIGGRLPNWLTTPIVVDSVHNLFRVAAEDFAERGGPLDRFLEQKQRQAQQQQQQQQQNTGPAMEQQQGEYFVNRPSLLLTP